MDSRVELLLVGMDLFRCTKVQGSERKMTEQHHSTGYLSDLSYIQ
jgi:hypothetical protein